MGDIGDIGDIRVVHFGSRSPMSPMSPIKSGKTEGQSVFRFLCMASVFRPDLFPYIALLYLGQ